MIDSSAAADGLRERLRRAGAGGAGRLPLGARPSRLLGVASAVLITALAGASGLLAVAGAAPARLRGTPAEVVTRSEAWFVVLAYVALLALAIFAYWWPRRARRNHVTAVASAVMSGAVVVLAAGAYWSCAADQSAGWTQAAWTVELFFANPTYPFGQVPGCPATVPLALQVARMLGPAVVSLGLVSVLLVLFRRSFERVRVRRGRGKVLVMGVHEDGLDYVVALADSLPDPARLAVLDSDTQSAACRQLRTLGIATVEIATEDPASLESVVARHGRRSFDAVHLIDPDPALNLDRLEAVQRALAASDSRRLQAPAAGGPRGFVRIDDPWAAEEWRRSAIETEGWVLDALGIHEATAHELVMLARRDACDALLVTGSGELALAVLAEVAQVRRETEGLRRVLAGAPHLDRATVLPDLPAVTVVDPGARALAENHALRQRRFGNAPPDVVVVAATAGRRVIENALEGAERPAVLLTAASSTEDAPLGVELAARHPSWLVLARAPGVRGISQRSLVGSLRTFAPTLQPGAAHWDTWERLARQCHLAYLARHGTPGLPAARDWEHLDPFYRGSNTRQVTTVLASAARAGFSWGATTDSPETAADVPAGRLEEMARAEHESWRAYCLAHGWVAGPRRDERRRTHPDLRPWAALAPESRAKAMDGVRDSLALLGTIGYHLHPAERAPDPGGWRRYRRTGEVRAERLDRDRQWHTEGGQLMRAAAGDWLVTGDDGQQWSISDDQLRRTYEPVAAGRYRRVGTVEARRAEAGETVLTAEGPYVCAPTDWVVRNDDGATWAVPAEHFAHSYDPVPGATAAQAGPDRSARHRGPGGG